MIGEVKADLETGEIRSTDGTVTVLRPKTAAMLRVLASRQGEVVGKEDLFRQVWPDTFVTEDGIVQCVGEIRRALGTEARAVLRTHPKRGYSLNLSVENPGVPAPQPRRWSMGLLAPAAALLAAAAIMIVGVSIRPLQANITAVAEEQANGPVVAVFPFDSLTPDERWQRLARALTQDIIADLGQNSWLFVLADATTRERGPGSPGKAAELGADYFVTGSVQAEEGVVRIIATLVDTETGHHLWSRHVEGTTDEFLTLQRAASEALVGELSSGWNGPIPQAGRAKARQRGIDDLSAYELFLLASERVHGYTPQDLADAVEMYQRVVALAPEFGEAWAQISQTTYNMVMPNMSQAEMERLWRQAEAAALEGYRVSPDDPHAVAQAANAIRWENPDEAERLIRRAAVLAPNNADILAYLSFRAAHYPALGPAAEVWIARAMRLNPDHPSWYDWNLGWVMMVVGRYAEAAEAFGRAPDHIDARSGRIAALALAGDISTARALMAALLKEQPSFTIGWHRDAAGIADPLAEVFAKGFKLAGAPE